MTLHVTSFLVISFLFFEGSGETKEVGFLGGRASCWNLYFSYGACCDPEIWGERGNMNGCFPEPEDRDFCCSADPEALPCNEHLLGVHDTSAYTVGRALEILACRCRARGRQAEETQKWLTKTVQIAQQLEDGANRRAIPLVALEWHRLSNESYASSIVLVRSLVDGAAGEYTSLASEARFSEDAFGARLRACARVRQRYPRARGAWSPWGFDGATRIGRTIWCLCSEREVQRVLDLFALFGSGGVLMAADALKRKGQGEVVTIEWNQAYANAAHVNLNGYPHRLITGDAFVELPKLCPSSFRSAQGGSFDVVVLDPFDLASDKWHELMTALKSCEPTFWVINNVQWINVGDVVTDLLANGYNLALYDFSPTLVAAKFFLQEFVVLAKASGERPP